MTDYEFATLASSVAIGLGQIGIVWYGIRAMNRASAARDRAMNQAARVADQRHTETMRALETLIARTAPATD